MGNKATADSGGQAAIGDIVNSTNITGLIGVIGNGATFNVIIQNLHVHFRLSELDALPGRNDKK